MGVEKVTAAKKLYSYAIRGEPERWENSRRRPIVKIYPGALSNHVRNDPRKRAEVKLYDALSQQLRGSWVIFYHLAWLGWITAAGAPRDGETDFIIAHPDFGILLVEVKGGNINYQGLQQQWISRDRGNNEHRIDPSPERSALRMTTTTDRYAYCAVDLSLESPSREKSGALINSQCSIFVILSFPPSAARQNCA